MFRPLVGHGKYKLTDRPHLDSVRAQQVLEVFGRTIWLTGTENNAFVRYRFA